MCGLAGFVGSFEPALLKNMTDAIAHRGPDGEGHWIDGMQGVGLGHRRLSIIDLSDARSKSSLLTMKVPVSFLKMNGSNQNKK